MINSTWHIKNSTEYTSFCPANISNDYLF